MNAAQLVKKNETVAVLPPSSLYELGRKNVPDSAVAAVTKLIDAGKIPSPEEVINLIETAKASARDAKNSTAANASATKNGSAEHCTQAKCENETDERNQAAERAIEMLKKHLDTAFSEFRQLYLKSSGQFDALICAL